MNDKSFGPYIQAIKNKYNLTTANVADVLSVSKQSVNNWISQRRQTRYLVTNLMILKAYGYEITTSDLDENNRDILLPLIDILKIYTD